jgi:FixJ family two-component response regulator
MMAAPTIFIVDDDESLRRSLGRLIRAEGWAAESYESARAFIERESFAGIGCILLDVRMPGISGTELHAELLTRNVSLPVVFLTAHGDLPTGIGAMKKGAVDFLQKPVDDELLLQTLREAVQHHSEKQSKELQMQGLEGLLAALSRRECEVLKQVIDGRLNKQIADDLGISIKTVKVHRGHVMEKMAVRSLAELVHLCELASHVSGRCLLAMSPAHCCTQRSCLNSGGRCGLEPLVPE